MDHWSLANQIEQLLHEGDSDNAIELCRKLHTDLSRQPSPRLAKGSSSHRTSVPVNEDAISSAAELCESIEAGDLQSAIYDVKRLKQALGIDGAGEKGE